MQIFEKQHYQQFQKISTKDLANSLIRTLKAPEECVLIYTKKLAILVSDLNTDLTLQSYWTVCLQLLYIRESTAGMNTHTL